MTAAPLIAQTFIDPNPNVYVAQMARAIPRLSTISGAPTVMGPDYIDPYPLKLVATF